ncbi:hypothetical protein NDK47_25670 [Brevibacillus ruminantium]|uniref:DUF4179 domain-containing protein n=1 Tax=Brevibacillus ruminantium TaxID=2950604 RepID=A0ABY4WEY2_9BACL|nr:hypothetical protein [Brevibacillus ruminantium]USG65454.1 hypothetical protein NDK47_25670 [Brevibacillus ruminantium]
MDIEKRLLGLKEAADQTILRELGETSALEERILNVARGGEETGPQRHRLRPLSLTGGAILVASLLIFAGVSMKQTDLTPGGPGPHGAVQPSPSDPAGPHLPPSAVTAPENQPAKGSDPSLNPEELARRDKEIRKKVEEIKEALRIGLTQEEVLLRIPGEYEPIDDGGDLENGADEFWGRSFFKQPGYVPEVPGHVVDEEGLQSGKVGVNLFLAWKEKKLYLYSIQYVQGPGNDVYFYWMRPNGTTGLETKLNERPAPSVFDLNDELKKIYFEYYEKKDDTLLKDLEPVDILKLYIFAEEEGDLHTQYALYIDDEAYEKPSLEQFLDDVINDPVGAENTQKWVADLKRNVKGFEVRLQSPQPPVIPEGEKRSMKMMQSKEALVMMEFADGREPLAFRMLKNQQGIWKVSWMPIQ